MKRFISIMTAMLTMSTLFTGCGDGVGMGNVSTVDAAANENLIVVLGNHMHNYSPDLSVLEYSLESACREEGAIAVIINDGDPYLASGSVIQIPKQQSGLSNSKIDQIVDSEVEQLTTLMKNTYAVTEEADLLASLELAAREANSNTFGPKTDVYVFDSGVSTKTLDMSLWNMENIDVQHVVSVLKSKNMIPDFSGMGVIQWYQAGDVDYKISRTKAEKIKEIWSAIIEEGGGTVVFHSDPSTNTFDCELPYVTRIPDTTEVLISDNSSDRSSEENEVSYEEPVVFPESKVGFNPGKTTFIDERTALESFGRVQEYLVTSPDNRILIAATTADWGDEKYKSDLSQKRAETVKNLLVDAGANPGQIETVGLGSNSGFYIYDHDSSGELVESIAEKNRTIVIMDMDSDIAVRIMNGSFVRSEY